MLRILATADTAERVVIVCQYTKTLDLLESLCNERSFAFRRVDGQTQPLQRQVKVNELNDPDSDVFVFLLSAKAGGTGLNLIGANRIILFDPDWNPA